MTVYLKKIKIQRAQKIPMYAKLYAAIKFNDFLINGCLSIQKKVYKLNGLIFQLYSLNYQ